MTGIPMPVAAVLAPAAAAEVLLIAMIALIAMMILIQSLPFMGRKLEELARQIQSLMARLVDKIKDAIQEIEELIKRNTRAGMRCSAELIRFRQLSQELLDLLSAPRPADELGRARLKNEIVELFQQWQASLDALLQCLVANGATL